MGSRCRCPPRAFQTPRTRLSKHPFEFKAPRPFVSRRPVPAPTHGPPHLCTSGLLPWAASLSAHAPHPQPRPKQASPPPPGPTPPPQCWTENPTARPRFGDLSRARAEGEGRESEGAPRGTVNHACSRITSGCQPRISPRPPLARSGVLQPQASGQRWGLILGTDGRDPPPLLAGPSLQRPWCGVGEAGGYPEEPFYLSANPRNKGTYSSRASSARKAQDILPAQLKNNSLILTASHKNILSQGYS